MEAGNSSPSEEAAVEDEIRASEANGAGPRTISWRVPAVRASPVRLPRLPEGRPDRSLPRRGRRLAQQNPDRYWAPSLCEEIGPHPAAERQAARLGFADLLSIGDEPGEILQRFPAVAPAPRRDGMPPEMVVRCMRNRA
jgi:hypothetical protein